MIWFWAGLAWLAVGVVATFCIIVYQWRQGTDITVADLAPLALLVILGPIAALMTLWEILLHVWEARVGQKITRDTVIIPGSKSAKVFKVLRQPQWPKD